VPLRRKIPFASLALLLFTFPAPEFASAQCAIKPIKPIPPLGCKDVTPAEAVLVAQTGASHPPQVNKLPETLWLGVDLSLGMSEDATVKKLAESGYNLRKLEPPEDLRRKGATSMWVVGEKGEGKKSRIIGSMLFASGKLVNVHRDLLPEGDEVEFGRQLYFAMHSLEVEGNSRCTIETINRETPDLSWKTATLTCGKKTIFIELQKFQKQDESVQLNEELSSISRE